MSTAAPDLPDELRIVELARAGDHDAFVALYRQDAPLAWRLALALTADAALAADAVSGAFARVLAPRRTGTPTSAAPFHLRLLAVTRHRVLDAGSVSLAYLAPTMAAPDPRPLPDGAAADDAELARRRATRTMQAFHQLPERWRTALWLLVVEGLPTAEAAAVLGVSTADARELFVRAEAGLRTQWSRDRAAAGHPEAIAPEHLDQQLQTVLPLPLELFDAVEARWRGAARIASGGPLRLILPGGRPVPRWAERGLLASTAALIALGITSALAVDRDPDVRRVREGHLADAPLVSEPTPPRAYLDEDDGPVERTEPTLTTVAATRRTAPGPGTRTGTGTGGVVAAADGAATTADTLAKRTDDDGPAPTTTVPPVLQVTAGIAPLLGVAVGDECTGVELVGQVIGCAPDTGDDPVTLDVDSSLLGTG